MSLFEEKGLTLQQRWEGSRRNFIIAVALCMAQWILTVAGFAVLVVFVQPL